MVSERIQRRIDTLLDEADASFGARDWVRLRELASDVLKLDPDNEDALTYRAAAQGAAPSDDADLPLPTPAPPSPRLPASFVAGRYAVRRFLGEGGASASSAKPSPWPASPTPTSSQSTTSEKTLRQSQGRLPATPSSSRNTCPAAMSQRSSSLLPLLPRSREKGVGGMRASRARLPSPRTSAVALRSSTNTASSTAISSPRTSSSPPTAPPRSATSASPSPWTAPASRSTG